MVMVDVQAGIRVVLESLQGAVVTLRGQVVRQTSSPLLPQSSKKSKSLSPPETVKAALFLRKVSLSVNPFSVSAVYT